MTDQSPPRPRPVLRLVPMPAEPTSRASKSEPAPPQAPASILSIEAAKIPTRPLCVDARDGGQRLRTRLIRQALKEAGVKRVSVTMATGSMNYWTIVRAAGVGHDADLTPDSHEAQTCFTCRRNLAAERKLAAIIVAALPDLDDRQRPENDFVFTVSVTSGLVSVATTGG